MKVKTWKAWHDPKDCPAIAHDISHYRLFPSPVRIVPEATWRKVMAVVKAANVDPHSGPRTCDALITLREHERKRK